MNSSSGTKYVAELLGTMTLVLIGCGSAVIAGKEVGFLGISFAFGFSVVALAYAIGPISGCHINPAVTIGMLTIGKIGLRNAIGHIVSQFIGAVIGAGILYLIASGKEGYSIAENGLGQNGYGPHSPHLYSLQACFISEVVFTFLFLIVIFGATAKNAATGFGGLAIGVSLFLIHVVSIPITGTSVNPARSFGPALFVGGDALSQLWLFIVAPVVGAIIAGLFWKYILGKEIIPDGR